MYFAAAVLILAGILIITVIYYHQIKLKKHAVLKTMRDMILGALTHEAEIPKWELRNKCKFSTTVFLDILKRLKEDQFIATLKTEDVDVVSFTTYGIEYYKTKVM